MRIFLIHNPEAGEQETDATTLVRLFEREGHHVRYHHADEEAFPGDAAEADAIAVAGGDGTIGKAIRGLHAAERPFVILPLGTANNIARSLGICGTPGTIVPAMTEGRERRLDLGTISGPFGHRVFIEGVGLGGLADLVAEGSALDMTFEEKKRYGQEAPPRILAGEAEHLWRVEVEGRRLPERLLLVEFLNMPLVGPNLPIGGGGWPDDGRLEIAWLVPEARAAFVGWLATMRIPPAPGLDRARGARAAFDWTGGALRIDDALADYPGMPARVELGIARRRLRILVPDRKEAITP
jgi:diacylglycerol kinase (ATP)